MPIEHPLLLVSAATVLALAAAYTYVGVRLVRRDGPTGDTRLALLLFAGWWWATAANQALGGLTYAAAAFGHADFALQLTYAMVSRLLLAGSLFGLMAYMVYLFTGRMRLGLLGAFYAAFYLLLLASVVTARPDGLEYARWRIDVHYAVTPPAPLLLLQFAALVLPPVAAALSYFRLCFRVDRPEQRFRIVLVSWTVIVWWIVAVLAGQRTSFDNDALQALNRIVGLLAGVAVLLAYDPPAWLQRRWRAPAVT